MVKFLGKFELKQDFWDDRAKRAKMSRTKRFGPIFEKQTPKPLKLAFIYIYFPTYLRYFQNEIILEKMG